MRRIEIPRNFARFCVAVSLGIAIPMVVLDPTASATSVAPLTVEQVTDASTYIVRGTVGHVWTATDDHGMVWTYAKVAVSQVLKGPDSPSELVVRSPGGTQGDVTTVVSGVARYSETEDVLLFLDQNNSGQLGTVGLGLGKYTVRRAPGETRKYVAQYRMATDVAYDSRFMPHPAPQYRQDLDTLLDRVESRVQAGWDGKPIPGMSLDALQRVNTLERRSR